jgi:hypothetical protein
VKIKKIYLWSRKNNTKHKIMLKKIILFLFSVSCSIILSAQVRKTIDVANPGTLYSILSANEINKITNLTLTGTIDARDFLIIRDSLIAIDTLDLSGVSIAAFDGINGTNSYIYNSYSYAANQIPYAAFSDHYGFKSIILPASITSIADYAFYYCENVTTVNIPSSVTEIGYESFAHCSAIDSIIIPPIVASIGESAFYDCTDLKKIVLPSTITRINESTFESCQKLRSVAIPSSVTYIGKSAFYYCDSLLSVTIPTSVDTIYDDAFYHCIHLSSITIPSSVKYLGTGAFTYCQSLQSIVLPSSITRIENNLFSYCDSLKSVSIPSSITSIGDYAFSYCDSLQAISIPSAVTSIGAGAFEGCVSLVSIDIPAKVSAIQYHTFYNCYRLKTLTIPSLVTSIGNYAFYHCDSLQSVNIPSTVTSIGAAAFYSCTSLTSIVLPSSVSKIQNLTFAYCINLKSITIPSSIESIGNSAFLSCTSLTSVYLPSSINTIEPYAFKDCSSLQSINLPKSLILLRDYAFQNDYISVLKSFTDPLTVYPVKGDTLYVPMGKKAAYESFVNYKFKVIIEFEPCVASSNLITIPGQEIIPKLSLKADTTVCFGQAAVLKATNAASYVWSTTATSQSITVSQTGTYSVTITATNGCKNTAQEQVTVHQPYIEQIKVVTFNRTSNAVVVAWTPTKGKQIASYALQRLNDQTGKYTTIANRGISDTSYVVDKQVNTSIQTYSYRLLTNDSICSDSNISAVHETIHLSCSQSSNASTEVQLTWNAYKGVTPDVYKVYAIENGLLVDSFTLGNTGNQIYQRSYTKHKAGYTYRVGFDFNSPVFTGTLKADSGPFSQSLSNMAESELTEIENVNESSLNVFPNPASNSFLISTIENAIVRLYSLEGQLLLHKSVIGTEPIAINDIPSGLYMVKITTNKTVVTRPLVIE